MFGEPQELMLYHFLADDTIEILEQIPGNLGVMWCHCSSIMLTCDLHPVHVNIYRRVSTIVP